MLTRTASRVSRAADSSCTRKIGLAGSRCLTKQAVSGSSWAAVGNISPVERGDIIGQGYFSQGVIAKRFSRATLVPYAEATFSRDSKGFDWDNKAVYGSGIKAIIPHGEVFTELGVGYLRENRFHSGRSAGALTVFMNFSFGWILLDRKLGR